MKAIEITPKDESRYLKFVTVHPLGSIHQTREWGEFQTKLSGRDKFWRFAVENDRGEILASALVIRQSLPMKKCWLYCPRGPLADYQKIQPLQALLQKIREFAHAENAVFFRFDPPLVEAQKVDWKALNSRPAHAHYQPENTLILDLSQSEEDILKQMKPKGRYNIKVAQKNGVHVRTSHNSAEDIDAFYSLLKATTSRDQFSGHNRKFYEDMLKMPNAKLYLADYQGKTIAGIIVTFFKDTTTYYFGASGNEHRNVMAPYLLQWQAVKEAKAAGYEYYDFLGVAPENSGELDRAHPWAGVTDFKLKFGGRRVNYVPAREIVYQPFWYAVMKLLKKFRP